MPGQFNPQMASQARPAEMNAYSSPPHMMGMPPPTHPMHGMYPAAHPSMMNPAGYPRAGGPSHVDFAGDSFRHLNDLWHWIECLPPQVPRGSLSEVDFRNRLTFMLQDSRFMAAMYRSYKTL